MKRAGYGSIFIYLVLLPIAASGGIRFKPGRAPEVRTFFISEIGYMHRLDSDPREIYGQSIHHYFESHFGLMRNVSAKYAVGMTNFFSLDNDGELRWGLNGRVRRWLGKSNSVDISAGAIFYDSDSAFKSPQFRSDLCFNIRDLLILSVGYGIASYTVGEWRYQEVPEYIVYSGTDHAVYTGIRVGSKPGLIGNILAAIAGVIFWAAFAGGD